MRKTKKEGKLKPWISSHGPLGYEMIFLSTYVNLEEKIMKIATKVDISCFISYDLPLVWVVVVNSVNRKDWDRGY